MQTKDLIKGRYYAYSPWNRYHNLERVQVVEADHTGSVKDGYRTTSKRGVLIEHSNGKREIVRAQGIKKTWADHEREEAEAKAAEAAQEVREAEGRLANAKVAFAAHEALVAKGVKPVRQYLSSADVAEALEDAGFDMLETRPYPNQSIVQNYVVSALKDPEDLVEGRFGPGDGSVSTAVLAVLLGLADASTVQPDDGFDEEDED